MSETEFPFLRGGGEMGERTRNFDWSASIGAPDSWPPSLRNTVSMILSSKFPMFLWWGEDMIQFYNDAYRPSLGNEGKHPLALGQKAVDCWPEIWDIIYPMIRQVQTTGEATWNKDALIPIYRNGRLEKVYWTFGYSPIRGDSDRIEGVLVVCQETTEQVESRHKIEENEQRLRSMILQAPVPICIYRGPEYVIEIANNNMFEFWGRASEEVLGKPLFTALPEVKNQGYEELLADVLQTGQPFSASELPVTLQRQGKMQEVIINFVFEPIRDPDGSISGIMAMATDVTEQVRARRRIEQVVAERTLELAEANEKMKKSNEELGQFAYIASHDLQEPLRKVITFSQMLEMNLGSISEVARGYLYKINNSTSRMLSLIRDVLAYSQLSDESESFDQVNLGTIAESVKTDFELLIEQTQAVFEISPLPVIDAIPAQMTQLFGNLLSNALKFSKDGVTPFIKVSTSMLQPEELAVYPLLTQHHPYVRIDFADKGIGFDQDNARQIFDIFQRLHGKADYAGTGIGLALCKKIVQNHHGEIYATSTPGKGAIFHIILPVKQGNFSLETA